jgi:hypothetical protein
MVKWMDYVEHSGEMRNTYGVLAGKPEGKRPLGRPKHRWVDWIDLDQDRGKCRSVVNIVMNLWVP